MEHLMLASGGQLAEHDVVPYVATKDYHDMTLAEFLRTVWPSREFAWFENPEKAASLIQTWFFFGLFQEVLGAFFVDTDYITEKVQPDGSSVRVLTTTGLVPALDAWIEHARRNLKADECLPYYRELFRPFGREDIFEPYNLLGQEGMRRQVAISMHSSAKLLDNSIRLAFGWNTKEMVPHSSLKSISPVDLDMMRKNGWCPSIASRCWGNYNLQAQMMMRTAPIPASDPSSHTLCTPQASFCAQIDNSTFQPKHVEPDCKCTMWSVDELSLDRIIENGLLPLLQFTVPESPTETSTYSESFFGQLELRLISSAGEVPYIALSHIWAHGLGNPKGNTLPRCQLQVIMSKLSAFFKHDNIKSASGDIQSLYEDNAAYRAMKELLSKSGVSSHQLPGDRKLHFWLDTLCCPALNLHTKSLTISKMRDIYSEASDVLVIDRCLESLDSSTRSAHELAMYVCTSTWSHRVWTWQEAYLAKRLWFRFNGSFIRADRLLFQAECTLEANLITRTQLGGHEFSRRLFLLNGGCIKDDPSKACMVQWNLTLIIRALSYRSLSVRSDEGLVLQNLIKSSEPPRVLANLTTAQLDKSDANMIPFWEACRRENMLGPGIIFNGLPRMNVDHYRWAPKSLLYDNHGKKRGHAAMGQVNNPTGNEQFFEDNTDHRGFVVKYTGFTISVSSPALSFKQLSKKYMNTDKFDFPLMLLLDKASGDWAYYRPQEHVDEIDLATMPDESNVQIAFISEPPDDGHLPSTMNVIASVITAGSFDSGRTFHHVRSHGVCTVSLAEPPLQRLLDRLLVESAALSPDDDEAAIIVTDELFDLAVAAMLSFFASRQAMLDRTDKGSVKKFIRRISRRLIPGHYLLITERFDGDRHRWIVD